MGRPNSGLEGGKSLPVYLSISSLQAEGSPNAWCLVVTDLTEQKKNEEILTSERLARSIIEQAAETIVVCDTSGRIIRFSNAMPKLCGCDPIFQLFEDLIDLRFSEGADSGESILPVSSALKGSTILGVGATLEPEDTQKFNFLLNSGPLKNDNGEIIGCVVTLTDITERKQAEEALRQSEQHYRLLFETMLQGVVYQDANGKIISMNPAAERILGKTTAEFLGSSSEGEEHYTIREDGSPFPGLEHPAMVSLRTGREVQDVVMGVYNPRENCYRWININAVPIIRPGEDKPFEVYTLFNDITERKQDEETLRKSEKRYRTLFNTMEEGFCIIEMLFDENEKPIDYIFVETNPAFEKDTGLKNAVGKRIRELAPENEEYWYEIYGKVALTGEPVRYENRAEALHRWYEVYAYRIGQPKSRKVAILFNDITERKQEEQRIRRYNHVLEGINRIFSNVAQAKTEEELANACLSVALEVTGSQIGFFNLVGADGLLHEIAIN